MPKNKGGYPYKGGAMSQVSEEAPQDECDKRGPDYDNLTPQSWITGRNEDATTKPGFDHSQKRR